MKDFINKTVIRILGSQEADMIRGKNISSAKKNIKKKFNKIGDSNKMKIFKNSVKVIFILIGLFLISGYIYFNSRYPEISEVPEIKIERTPERIERGKYLFNNVSGCIDCHSTRDFSKLSGPIIPGTEGMGGMKFSDEIVEGLPGTFYASNITPYALENWTDGEILRAITEGISKDGRALFPVMPYLSLGKMDKEDIYSIIAYLRTLPSIKNDVPKSRPKFPMNIIIKTLPAKNRFSVKPELSDKIGYGKYLVEAAGCNDCHTPSKNGNPVMEKLFAGGSVYKLPGNMIIRPANITPDSETGIGLWTKEQFVNTFKTRSAPENYNTTLKPQEPQTVMAWSLYGKMNTEDLGAIYEYLRSVTPVKNNVNKFEIKLY